jgi:8-oxo-dGTP pyrophosphatase MutT (NUDIX family)
LSALAVEMKKHKVGDNVKLTVLPYSTPNNKTSKKPKVVTVALMTSPDDERAIIGFIPADTRITRLPFEVNISTTDIGGPSAGLAFTLALLDELTPGNLMGNGRVAATGTMDEEQNVGAIGALKQKAVAVRDSGGTLFLVPAGQSPDEMKVAQAAAGPGVRIVQVATLDAALRETEEEIGVSRSHVQPLGYLGPYFSSTGFRITPVVGLVAPDVQLSLNPREVDRVFEAPLAFLMNPANHQTHQREFKGEMRSYFAMPHGDHYIWGVTAGILRNLYEKLYLR